ncbi:MAG TPA: YciI family protein [Steroidobacteraceae bacterium]|nr:YciI family protein [Steroidobacteraceae bacterium]
MKVMVFVKATPNSEAGLLPSDEATQKMFAEMGKFNEKLAKAGIIKAADGLQPSKAGKRIKFTDNHATVVDGPFAETKELVAGFWIWEVKSLAEAVEWAKRCPNPMPGEEGVLEIRPFYEMEAFDHIMTDEIREREERVRKLVERQQKPKAKAKAKVKAKPAKRKPPRARSKK